MRTPTKPKALQPGQTVGLVAPSSALKEKESLDKAVAALEALGYAVRPGESCLSRHGYLAGPDALRARDIHTMFADDTVDAILCLRGGYGAMRLLNLLDYGLIRAHPKIFSGYSDVTALHAAFLEKANLVTFHGLMAASDFAFDENDPFSLASFFRTVTSPTPVGALENPDGCERACIVSGQAQGPLLGGNLTMLAASLGTPYAYRFDGAILFLEEVSEHTYCVDRLLTHLKNAGVFGRVAGVVLGAFTGCKPENPPDFSTEQVVQEILGDLSVPVMSGLQCGHEKTTLTLPIGIPCALDTTSGTLTILEGAVV